MNNVTLIGRMTRDPELRYTSSGTAVASFTIAVDRRFKSDNGPEADFIPVVVWAKLAEVVAEHCRKGREVAVNGEIQTRNYDKEDGTRVYVTEINADEVKFLREPSGDGQQPQQQSQQQSSGNNRSTGNNTNRNSGNGNQSRQGGNGNRGGNGRGR